MKQLGFGGTLVLVAFLFFVAMMAIQQAHADEECLVMDDTGDCFVWTESEYEYDSPGLGKDETLEDDAGCPVGNDIPVDRVEDCYLAPRTHESLQFPRGPLEFEDDPLEREGSKRWI